MKRVIYILVVVFALSALTSCGARKQTGGGCGMTADNQSIGANTEVVADLDR